MGLFDKLKGIVGEASGAKAPAVRTTRTFHIKSHLFGDEDPEEIRQEIMADIKDEDPLADVHLWYHVNEAERAAANGDEDMMYPIDLEVVVTTALDDSDTIACISANVLDLYVTDDEGNVVYTEEDLVED